jgi:glucokinase
MQSVPEGHPCGCGRLGCLEQYSSGTALVRFARDTAQKDPAAAPVLMRLTDGDPLAITGLQVTEAARQGDPAAVAAFDTVGHWLGVAMADLAQILDPQVLVIGGGVIDAGELLMGPTQRTYRTQLQQRGRLPVAELKAAELGNTAGVVGAADLARRA